MANETKNEKKAEKELKKLQNEKAKNEKKAEKELKKIQDEAAKKEKKANKALEARDKRKESIQKSAEKQAAKEKKRRNMTKKQKVRRVLIPVVIFLCALAIALCGFFGVFDRAIAAEKTADGDRISIAEVEYYNRMYYNYYYQMSSQYEQYYASYYGTGAGALMTGFDYTKTPADQEFTANEESGMTIDEKYGDNPTWADYFEQESLKEANSSTMLYKQAVSEGYELTEDEQDELDEFIDSLKENAESDSYSLDAYLRTNYGRGMSTSLLKEIYTKQTIVNRYKEDKEAELQDAVTSDEIKAEFKENAKDYTTVDMRNFTFTSDLSADDEPTEAEIKKANKALKKEAQAFLDAATLSNFTQMAYDATEDEEQKELMKDDDSYSSMDDTTYDSLADYVSEEAAEWAFDSDRKSGDKKLIEVLDDDGIATYYVYIMETPGKKDTQYPVSVRQILFMVTDEEDTDSEDTTSEDEDSDDDDSDATESETGHTDAEAKKLAKDALAQWKKGDATDESFAELATELTEDTGSVDNGGLYEDVTEDSSYVEEFLDWCFADGREVGDTGIIKTDYGYHVMYLSSKSDEPVWKTTVREAIASEQFDEYLEDTIKADDVKISDHWNNKIAKRLQKAADTVITNAGLNS